MGALVAACAALVPALWMWGFTVDDALIAIRYARHLASGAGYRFDVGGPMTDGVTPLPWPFLLAPFARSDALTVLSRAQLVGVVAWILAAAVAGARLGRIASPSWAKLAAALTLALCIPVAANAVSGMETALALSLATLAACAWRRPLVAAAVAGVASSLRPEMAAWAIVLAVGFELAREPHGRIDPRARRALVVVLAVAPFTVCAVVRAIAFGRPAPLALMAKPSDVEHGLAYAGAAIVVTLAPIVVCAPLALLRTRGPALAIACAALAHLAAVVAVGGDWMPYARLVVPVVPSLLVAFVLVASRAHRVVSIARVAIALGMGVLSLANGGTSGRHVGADRATLVELARPHLANARRVAALDIGWTSAATEASIMDLAGLTDPAIAALPGGHTSKRVDPVFLLERDPDVILVYVVRGEALRVVEARLVRSELIRERYERRAFLPLGASGAGYDLLTKR